VADMCASLKFSPARDLPASLRHTFDGGNQKVPGFESHPGQELSLADRICISMMCYAASVAVTPT
jgi:hypothetical protein